MKTNRRWGVRDEGGQELYHHESPIKDVTAQNILSGNIAYNKQWNKMRIAIMPVVQVLSSGGAGGKHLSRGLIVSARC